MSKCILWLVGMPLDESGPLSSHHTDILQRATIIIGESRRNTLRRVHESKTRCESIFFLDNIQPKTLREVQQSLDAMKEGEVALFSDHGLCNLFDPGEVILKHCKSLGFDIRTVPGPASWAVAAGASGYAAPFFLYGFLPQKAEARKAALQELLQIRSHIIFLETPYRFKTLVDELSFNWPPPRELFLAWELGTNKEILFWGTPKALKTFVERQGLAKGEFILIAKAKGN